jgi:hypothetical protein
MLHSVYASELLELLQFLAFTWKPTKFHLRLRSLKLALQYIVKLKSNPGNPAYSLVFQPNYTALFAAKPSTVPTLGLQLRQALSESGIILNCIAQRLIRSTPPWLLRTSGFNYTFYNVGTRCNTFPDLYLSLYIKVVSASVSHDKV